MIDKNEFRKITNKFWIVLSNTVMAVRNILFDTFKPVAIYIYPAREDLNAGLHKLIKKQFPKLNISGNPFLLLCIDDIIRLVADSMSSEIHNELRDIDAGVNKSKDYAQFQLKVKLYASKLEPALETVENYAEFTYLTYGEKVVMVNEKNKGSIASSNELNEMRYEFLEAVQPILSKYYGVQLEKMNNEDWERYALEIGYSFYSYRFECISLICYLEKGLLTGNPEMNFFEFRARSYMKS